MEKITQQKIADVLDKKQSTVSKYLRGVRNITLVEAAKVETIGLPITIFISAKEQKEYLGKSYIQEDQTQQKGDTLCHN